MGKSKQTETLPLTELSEEIKKNITTSVMEKALELYKLEVNDKDYETAIFDILAKSFKEKVK